MPEAGAAALPARTAGRRSIRRLLAWTTGLAAVVLLAGLALGLGYFHTVRHVSLATDPAADAVEPAFERLAAALAARGTDALVVVRDGRLLHEWYRSELDPVPEVLKRRDLASATKAVTGGVSLALLGQEGLIALDDPVARHVPEWRDDPARAGITLRQLATHSAGLRGARQDDELAWARTYMREPQRRLALALDAPLIGEPGREVVYSNPGFGLLAYAVASALHGAGRGDLKEFLRERLWEPLDVPGEAWRIGYGKPMRHGEIRAYELGGGTRLTARAMARLGGLLAAGGSLDGRQIIERRWLEAVTTPTDAALPADWRERRQPAAALGWWVNRNGVWPEAPPDTMVAAGYDHQLLIVIPSLDIAVARFGGRLGADGFNGDYWQAFDEILLTPLMAVLRDRPVAPRASALPTSASVAAGPGRT